MTAVSKIALTFAVLFPRSVSGDNVDSVQVGIAGATLPGKPSHRHGIAEHHQQYQPKYAKTSGPDSSLGHRQATTSHHHTPNAMKCNDATEGFVAFGGVITGLIKSCAEEARILQADEVCMSSKCDVDPDRNRCCRAKKCDCPNGVSAKADDCKEDGQHDCESCSTGYSISQAVGPGAQTCNPNECKCPGGTGTTGANCATDGGEDCSECGNGYTLTGEVGSKKCVANVCTCQNGDPSTAANTVSSGICMKQGDADCAQCDQGYVPSTTFSKDTLTTCAASPCATDKLPSSTEVDVSQCDGKTTGETCPVSCKDGYTGRSQTYTCGADSQFSGNSSVCTPNKCEKKMGTTCFGANTESAGCSDKATGDTCNVKCAKGYGSNEATYTCEAGGWECAAPVECLPDTCTVDSNIANGGIGNCEGPLAGNGGTCDIECNGPAYKVSGRVSCTAGVLTTATCVEAPCTGAAVPHDGHATKGNCEDTMASGTTCTPTCAAGYTLKSDTSCSKSILTAGVCESDLKCTLTFGKDLGSMDKGYWSEDENNMDYAGCERFCTQKNANGRDKITGCELTMVPGSARTKKGKYCFAHIEPWSSLVLGDKTETAACKVTANSPNDISSSDLTAAPTAATPAPTAATPAPTARACLCDNGSPSTGADCTTHNEKTCAACNAVYYLSGTSCVACSTCGGASKSVKTACSNTADTVCECARGFAGATPESCNACTGRQYTDAAGEATCKTCHDGASGRGDLQGDNPGNQQCENGKCQRPALPDNAALDNCPDDAAHGTTCTLTCQDGYTAAADPQAYTCTAVAGSGDAEYTSGSISCAQNVCTCKHGTHATGADCPSQGAMKCLACDAGWLFPGSDTCKIPIKERDWSSYFDGNGDLTDIGSGGGAITGLYRSDGSECKLQCIETIKVAEFEQEDCEWADWGTSFDGTGQSTCNSGFFVAGFRKSSNDLYGLEGAYCCKRKGLSEYASVCDAWTNWGTSFDSKGWSTCPKGSAIAGLSRGDSECKALGCIEQAKCCRYE